ncbi:hypothetical protein [Crocosphaera sp. XPORK-15E]|uniref:hypothetical protein n=1 Tax=Crocosphaera sp. XPORK-15E TaxID=3110247 RepID=UPI002B221797|nr:hypothetical protein [Crocosphaera sp. XPORK-15E]MEA5536082.1 hypothetical protein [Crocosphaera sp. XPORK-15E]
MKTFIQVALIALLWLTVINPGQLYGDTPRRLTMAHALWTGTEEISSTYQPTSRLDIDAGLKGVDGRRYYAYDMGQALLMLPGDWLGTMLMEWFPSLPSKLALSPVRVRSLVVSFLIFVPVNVATVMACFWLLRLFEFQERIAGLTSLAWLMGTTVLHYGQIHQQNNQILLLTTIGYATALACVKRKDLRFAILSGLALGGAWLIRSDAVIHTFTVFLFLLGCCIYDNRDKFKVLQVIGMWIGGFIPFILLGRIFQYIRFGTWLPSILMGQSQRNTDPFFAGLPQRPSNYAFSGDFLGGLLGVLFSPAKSIFIYDPLLLPCLGLAFLYWRRFSPYVQWYIINTGFNLALYIALSGRIIFWHGDWAWGPRYQVTSLQLLLIPLLGFFIMELLSSKSLKAWLMRIIISLAILVQIASVTMFYRLEVDQSLMMSSTPYWTFRLGMRVTNIVCLINPSFSEQCISQIRVENPQEPKVLKYYPLIERNNKLFYLPFWFFQPNRPTLSLMFFGFWSLVLVLATFTTIKFCLG